MQTSRQAALNSTNPNEARPPRGLQGTPASSRLPTANATSVPNRKLRQRRSGYTDLPILARTASACLLRSTARTDKRRVVTAVTGSNPGTWAFSLPPYPATPYITLGFSSGVVNRPGPDLVWFEVGSPNDVEICLVSNCSTRALSASSPTGYFVTGPGGALLSLNAAEFDLDSFSIPLGDSVNSIVAWLDTLTGPVTRPALAVMAANPIPEPSGLWLLALGLFGIGFSRRRKLH